MKPVERRHEESDTGARVEGRESTEAPFPGECSPSVFAGWHRSWLETRDHAAGCACKKCIHCRGLAREAVAEHDVDNCTVVCCDACWAMKAIIAGKI